MSILIRKADLQDIEDVFEIQEKQGLSFWSVEDYQSEITNSESIFLVAESDGKIVGFIFARLITTLKICEILNFGVADKCQNQGIGKQLVDNLTEIVNTLKYEKIELEVREQNHRAINFYLKNNFLKDGIRKNFYQNPTDDAVLMSQIFS
jgi:[ribosomal protein S18]-alanine N-acetyltransferase